MLAAQSKRRHLEKKTIVSTPSSDTVAQDVKIMFEESVLWQVKIWPHPNR